MTSTVKIGSVIDNYKILEKIGKGGMGLVFKALNIPLDKFVAIKTIALGFATEENFTNRFRTEARALARLHDPNIVSIYDLRADDNQWYIVMEYVEGITLAQMIMELGFIPWQKALHIFKQMLSAIGHAHRAGIIHRDIKPNNIMVTKEEVVKITDFGLAKDQKYGGHTITAATGGTLHYMSPEQVKGLVFTDHRSDIYSLGLTFYEMLAGKIPFRKDDTDFSIREAIIKRQFPPPTQYNSYIPMGLNTIIMKTIEKKPEDRFQNISEILQDIEKFEQEQGILVLDRPNSLQIQPATTKLSSLTLQYRDISSYHNERSSENNHKPEKPFWKTNKLLRVSISIILPVLLILISFVYLYFYIIDESQKGSVSESEDKTNLKKIDRAADNNTQTVTRTIKENNLVSKPAQDQQKNVQSHDRPIQNKAQKITTQITDYFRIESDPPGASIYVDDMEMELGTTPFQVKRLSDGTHKITLEKEGYETYRREIRVNINNTDDNNLIAYLTPLMTDVQILVKPWGSIFIDGILEKQNTNVKHNQRLSVGKHTIKILHPSFGFWEKTVELKKNKPLVILVDFNKFVSVPVTAFDTDGTPVWAEIVVDNNNTGKLTPKQIDVRIGYHSVAARKEGYILVNGERQIMFENNLDKPLKFILRKVL